jgi:hypothetical protein
MDILSRMEGTPAKLGVMNRVKTRLSVGELTPANYKNIKSKVEWFKKKDAEGKLTEKLRPRLDEAEELWQQMQALRLEGASGASSSAAAAAAAAAAAVKTSSAAAATPSKGKKTPKTVAFANNHATSASSASASAPAASVKPPVKGILSLKKKQRPAEGIIEQEIEDMEAENAENSEQGPMTNLNYIRIASEKKLPLPEFYDPYTGKKFLPEESPMEPIERAYKQLKNLRKTVYANAKRMKNAGSSSRKTRKARNQAHRST